MYNEGGYGQKAVEKLLALTKENDICVVDTVSVSVGQKEPSFTSIVDNLYKKGDGAKVIYFYLQILILINFDFTMTVWRGHDNNMSLGFGVPNLIRDVFVFSFYCLHDVPEVVTHTVTIIFFYIFFVQKRIWKQKTLICNLFSFH